MEEQLLTSLGNTDPIPDLVLMGNRSRPLCLIQAVRRGPQGDHLPRRSSPELEQVQSTGSVVLAEQPPFGAMAEPTQTPCSPSSCPSD
jgi:hypothetical protein